MKLRIIQSEVSKFIYPRIFGIKKAKATWELSKNEFRVSSIVISIKLQTLWRDFDNLKMMDDELVIDFSTRVVVIVNQITSCGDEILEKKIVKKILRNLPKNLSMLLQWLKRQKIY